MRAPSPLLYRVIEPSKAVAEVSYAVVDYDEINIIADCEAGGIQIKNALAHAAKLLGQRVAIVRRGITQPTRTPNTHHANWDKEDRYTWIPLSAISERLAQAVNTGDRAFIFADRPRSLDDHGASKVGDKTCGNQATANGSIILLATDYRCAAIGANHVFNFLSQIGIKSSAIECLIQHNVCVTDVLSSVYFPKSEDAIIRLVEGLAHLRESGFDYSLDFRGPPNEIFHILREQLRLNSIRWAPKQNAVIFLGSVTNPNARNESHRISVDEFLKIPSQAALHDGLTIYLS
jgi:hypothetical protein